MDISTEAGQATQAIGTATADVTETAGTATPDAGAPDILATTGTRPPGAGAPVTAGPVTPSRGPKHRRRRGARRSRRRLIVEWVVILAVAAGLALLVRAYVAQTFYVPSGSMEPTLQVGDRILVDKLSYHLHGVGRGDIIVFRRPPRETADLVPDLVKRVIGLPGDTVAGRDGNVYVNGKLLAQPWLRPGVRTAPFGPVTVPPGQYFVMGDNRSVSYDSRDWGPVPASYIVGKVVLRIWPLSRFGFP
jgi:signal peptidase I